MAVSLIGFSIPESLLAGTAVGTGNLGGGWRLSHSPLPATPQIGTEPFKISIDNLDAPKSVQIVLNEKFKWLRYELDIPQLELTKSTYKYVIKYKCLGPEAGCGPQVKILEYTNGTGETFLMISNGLARSGSVREIENTIEVPHAGIPDASYRLCIEFRNPVDFCLTDIELIKLESDPNTQLTGREVSPYNVYDFQVSAKLKDLNQQMDSMMRKSPLVWICEMLKVALSLEDYDTASGLVRYLEHSFDKDSEFFKIAGDLMLNTMIATGDTAGARQLMTKTSAGKQTSDNTIIISRAIQTRNKPHQNYDLPSGKSDIFNLSKDLLSYDDVEFEAVLRNAPDNIERHLLWANYIRSRSEADYLKHLNLYLGNANIPFDISLASSTDNILSRISFSANRPLDLPSSGPLVTVIIAAYNAASTINYAVTSILNQTYKNIEVLICDDGSQDNTRRLIKSFSANPRVRIFETFANQGPYNIRNWLLSKANGEVITFHDSDDVALPNRIAAQLKQMIVDRNSVAMGQWLRVRDNGHIVAFKDGTYQRNCLNSIMFTPAIFEKYGPYRKVVCAADSEFYETLRGKIGQKNISILKQPLVLGLWGTNSLTRTSGLEADELGYRAVSRRQYIAIAARQRILGRHVISDNVVQTIANTAGIYRKSQGIEEVTGLKD
jgi:hypothetical protein